MADKAHTMTDEKLEQMERHLSAIYSRAYKEVGEDWKKYLEEAGKELAGLEKEYQQAKRAGDQAAMKKVSVQLSKMKREKTIKNQRFRDLTEQLTAEIYHVNETATAYVNGRLPEIYLLNYNAFPDTAGDIAGYSFTLVDQNTVKLLAASDPDLLPTKTLSPGKDMRWNRQIINAEVLQGIIQGKSIDRMADSILQNAKVRNKAVAVRTARTCVTGAENRGRLDSFKKAEADGIIMQKEWVSTNDNRTRHAHAMLDGQTADVEKPFHSDLGDIRFPGDPTAHPANVYNCRCTLTGVVVGFKKLEEAEPQAQTFEPMGRNDEEAAKYALDKLSGWKKKATPKQLEALQEYTTLSAYINDQLEGKSVPDYMEKKVKDDIKRIDKVMEKAEMPENLVLYRGADGGAIGITGNVTEEKIQNAIGKEFQQKKYLSTSGSESVAEIYSRGIVLEIDTPKGTRAIFGDVALSDKKTVLEDVKSGDANLEIIVDRDYSFAPYEYEIRKSKRGVKYFYVKCKLV